MNLMMPAQTDILIAAAYLSGRENPTPTPFPSPRGGIQSRPSEQSRRAVLWLILVGYSICTVDLCKKQKQKLKLKQQATGSPHEPLLLIPSYLQGLRLSGNTAKLPHAPGRQRHRSCPGQTPEPGWPCWQRCRTGPVLGWAAGCLGQCERAPPPRGMSSGSHGYLRMASVPVSQSILPLHAAASQPVAGYKR